MMDARIDDGNDSNKNRDDQEEHFFSISDVFDELCFTFGDEECIEVIGKDDAHQSLIYFEVQEYSKNLAYQLYWRYRPSYVLIDCHGWPGAEIVAMLACIRLGIPFVPVSCYNQHAGRGRLATIIEQLASSASISEGRKSDYDCAVVALTCCANDQDPVLGIFQQANVHSILFLDSVGNLREALDVPNALPESHNAHNDNLYILFTSGTSGRNPKAVIGSHRSTLKRIHWFQKEFVPSPRVAKRTPLTFVDAIAELLGTLLTHQSILVALEPIGEHDVVDTEKVVVQTQCTQITMLPSQLSQLLLLLGSHRAVKHALQRIIISGEPCQESVWASFKQQFFDVQKQTYSCELINLYGQTETTGDCCGAILTDLDDEYRVMNHIVTVGKPLREGIIIHTSQGCNNRIGNDLKCSHELVVSGNDCFANGYLGKPKHEEGFIFDSARAGQIVSFFTGDVGFCHQGYWYVQGRKDDVEKINGVLTCPAEVETAYLEYCKSCITAAAAVIMGNRVYVLAEGDPKSSSFSRQYMKEKTGLPWNLIPYQVFACSKLPRTSNTNKVDRSRVKEMVKEFLAAHTEGEHSMSYVEEHSLGRFQAIVASVLDGQTERKSFQSLKRTIDLSKSFVELGGDSASTISLLYLLRIRWQEIVRNTSGISASGEDRFALQASDILNANSLNDLWNRFFAHPDPMKSPKKPRLQREQKGRKPFVPQPVTTWKDHHQSLSFAACVDVTPLKTTDSKVIWAACQDGVIQKVWIGESSTVSKEQKCVEVIEFLHLEGYRISSPLVRCRGEGTILVCANRHPNQTHETTKGPIVMSLSEDSLKVDWCHEFSPGTRIKSQTLFQDHLWLVICSFKRASNDGQESGLFQIEEHLVHQILRLNVQDGSNVNEDRVIDLPACIDACPIFCTADLSCQVSGGSQMQEPSILVFASSGWEPGLLFLDVHSEKFMLMNEDGNDRTDGHGNRFFADKLGPIFKEMLVCDGNCILAADFWGCLHRMNLKTKECRSIRLSDKALSMPTIVPSSSNQNIVVGAYDGLVRCVDSNLSSVLWECNVESIVYAKPLALSDNSSLIVCTTAGDVIQICHDSGRIIWKYRIPVGAEIWSDPVEVASDGYDNDCSLRIAFGARDSRLHIVEVKPNKGS